jgi:hypothetical protein
VGAEEQTLSLGLWGKSAQDAAQPDLALLAMVCVTAEGSCGPSFFIE